MKLINAKLKLIVVVDKVVVKILKKETLFNTLKCIFVYYNFTV